MAHARRPQLLLAGKATLAVAIAWLLAPLLPGVANDYPYYAPLGALVSMYPTLMGSLKNGLQTLAGLTIGVLLAGAVIVLSEPNVFTISLVVGIGFLISGSRHVTTAREFIPITALFVLIIGGPNADSYSIGYLVQVCLGIVVGLLVNGLVFPALPLKAAAAQLSRFRALIATHLSEISEALKENWPPEREEWAARSTLLAGTGAEVREAVRTADESRKGNPRARVHRRDLNADYDDLAALDTVAFHVRDLTEVLAAAVWNTPLPVELPTELRPPLSEALQAIATLLEGWDAGSADMSTFDTAEDAVQALLDALDLQAAKGAVAITPTATVAMDLRRILVALRPGVERDIAALNAASANEAKNA